MRRTMKAALSLLAACVMAGCSAGAEEHVGEGQGYGGPVKVRVTMEGDRISKVEVI